MKPLKKEKLLSQENYFHPYVYAEIFIADEKMGRIFSFTPMKRKLLGWKGNVVFVELNFDSIFQRWDRSSLHLFSELDKYPPAKFEISLVVPIRTYFSKSEFSLFPLFGVNFTIYFAIIKYLLVVKKFNITTHVHCKT